MFNEISDFVRVEIFKLFVIHLYLLRAFSVTVSIFVAVVFNRPPFPLSVGLSMLRLIWFRVAVDHPRPFHRRRWRLGGVLRRTVETVLTLAHD